MTRTEKAAPLLALIRKHESDKAVWPQGVPSAYDVVYSGIPKQHRPMAPLSTYTILEILEWQMFVINRGSASSAAGAYQIIRKTLQGLGLPSGARFDADCQDGAAMILLDRRGWDDCEKGLITPEAFGDNLAKEWASLPVITGPKRGLSYYAGDGLNRAHATPEEVMEAIDAALMLPSPIKGLRARVAALEARLDAAGL